MSSYETCNENTFNRPPIFAHLGTSCEAEGNVLMSNAKFIPLNDPIYKRIITKMYQYPGRAPLWNVSEGPHYESNYTLDNVEEESNTKTDCCSKN